VHGAMRVLTEFSRDLTDMQLPHVAPVILSEMYRIFEDEQVRDMLQLNKLYFSYPVCTFLCKVG
jgi:hypothetical protein